MAPASGFLLVLICLLMPSMTSAEEEKKEKVGRARKLYEISPEAKVSPGIEPFLEGNMEPTGVVVVGYVKQGSPNHQLLKKLASITKDEDEALWDLSTPMAAALDWDETESLHIVKRLYAKVLWDDLETEPLDMEPVVWPKGRASKNLQSSAETPDPFTKILATEPGKPWKEKVIRQWILDNAFPTINWRLMGYNQKKDPFPWDKYFGKSNADGGVALIITDIGKDWDFEPQFRCARRIKPWVAELHKRNIKISVMEKSKATLTVRQGMKLGLNKSHHTEFIIMDNACPQCQGPIDNFRHGDPKKYRLTDLANETAVKEFFEAYLATPRTLPTYWASLEEGQKKKKVKRDGQHHLSSWNFEEFINNTDPLEGVLVAFFNDDPKSECKDCPEGRKTWSATAKEFVLKKKEFKRIVMASIDQSANEHGENLVPGKLSGPMVVWYPPGNAAYRQKKKRVLHAWSTPPSNFIKEKILENTRDLLEDLLNEELEGNEEL